MKWDRKQISKPGIYDSVPMEAYHDDLCVGPSVSSSGLRTIFEKSPAHYFVDSYLNPHRIEEPEGAHLVLGRAAHHLLLGEDDFSTQFIVRPDEWDSWRTNAAKVWRAREEEAGRTVLLPEQLDIIRGMARSLAAHPLIRSGILNGAIEQSFVWQDKATGIYVKARPDAVPTDSGDFSDLKTSAKFGFDLDREVSNHRYDMQAALTGMGYEALTGEKMSSFSFCFVEKTPPYSVEVLTLDMEDIERAKRDLRVAIDTFAWCVEHNNWFGPSGTQMDARYVHVSDFAQKNAEFRRDFLRREIERAEKVSAEYASVP